MIIAVSSLVAEQYGERIRAVASNVELVWPEGEGWSGDEQAAGVAYFSEDFWTTNRDQMVQLFTLPNLRWFHSFAAGVDHPAFRALLERGVTVTNSPGGSSPAIAQYVIGMMLRVAKRMDAWAESQRDRRWAPIPTEELTGKTLGIIGVGHIGGEVARLAQAFGMRVVGCRRSQRRIRHVDEIVPPERLRDLLTRADFVVLAVPLTAATEGLIGETELRAMRDDAWLINVSRGRVVDEAALVRALRDGVIGGACLDVFHQEPLPLESELWSLPNAIVTPHNSGWSPLNRDRVADIFLDNLRRYASRRPLRNVVRLADL
ncbi:MAG: D-2-hydroxyacid dehydrogenase [Dehalococcoidia bacterium]